MEKQTMKFEAKSDDLGGSIEKKDGDESMENVKIAIQIVCGQGKSENYTGDVLVGVYWVPADKADEYVDKINSKLGAKKYVAKVLRPDDSPTKTLDDILWSATI